MRRTSARARHQSAIKLTNLLIIHEFAASGNDIVLQFKCVDGLLSRQGLLSQFTQSFLQPRGGLSGWRRICALS